MNVRSDPSISVIIPCFNRADLVGRAIESAMNQGPDVEIVGIDDGSSDNSADVISRYARVITVRTPNRGVSAARNLGLRISKGRFIKFLDSDDVLPEGSLPSLLEAAAILRPSQIAVGTASVRSERQNPPQYGYSNFIERGPIPGSLLLRHPMPCGLPLFPRDALNQAGGFDERISIGEDYVLAARLHASGYSFVQLPVHTYEVSDHDCERLTRRCGAEGFNAQLQAFSAARKAVAGTGFANHASIGQIAWALARDASRQGYQSEAEALFAFASETGGKAARVGPAVLKLLYLIAAPYHAEKILEAVKSVRRRA